MTDDSGKPEVVVSEFTIFGFTFRDREPVRWDMDWNAYDVPRIWSMVQGEENQAATRLVTAFNNVSQAVDAAQERLTEAATRLAEAWSGSPSSALAQEQIGEVIGAMKADATVYASAGRQLDQIIERLGSAKEQVKPLYERWGGLADVQNSDNFLLEKIAESEAFQKHVNDTNQAARDEMRRLERDLSSVTVPMVEEFKPGSPPSKEDVMGSPLGGANAAKAMTAPAVGAGSVSSSPPPPIPGAFPLPIWREDGEYVPPNDAGLAGVIPQPVPVTPGGPASMVPLQPGHPLAPNGGALVLPSPGTGGGGIVQRPLPAGTGPGGPSVTARPGGTPIGGIGGPGPAGRGVGGGVGGLGGPGAAGRGAGGAVGLGGAGGARGGAVPGAAGVIGQGPAAGGRGPAGAGGAAGVVGGAMGAGGGAAGGGAGGRGRADVKWSARGGVSPVIDGQPVQKQADPVDDFDTWYSGLATPWK